jgi:hypothetical protein
MSTSANLYYGYGWDPVCNITDERGFSLPAFGPYSLGDDKPRGYLPFVTQWCRTEIVPPGRKLDRYSPADVKRLPTTQKSYPKEGLVNEHALWEGKSGLMFFHASMRLPEPMKVDVLMGYDGPFRLWLDGKPFFVNMKGINPCFADESCKTVLLKKGLHEMTVGMDLNSGNAWGFFLRFARRDVTKDQIASGDFAKPVYSA